MYRTENEAKLESKETQMEPAKYDTWDEQAERRRKGNEEEERMRAAFEPLDEPEFKHTLIVAPGSTRLVIFDIDDLTAARALLRSAFGSWNDRLDKRFYSGCAITVWKSTNGHPCAIWFECKIEDYPESLKSDKCKWIESDNTGVSVYRFACAV
jgi:hypothetical protein